MRRCLPGRIPRYGNLRHFKENHQATKVVDARKLLDLLATGQI